MGRFQARVFDGAESLVNFGSFATGNPFVKAGVVSGVEVTIREARAPTGMGRREAVRTLRQMPQWAPISQQFQKKADACQTAGLWAGDNLMNFHT